MKGYKTYVYAIAVFLLGIIQSTDFQSLLSAVHVSPGTATIIVSVGIAFFRSITSTAPLKGE